jgi:nucleotide-binding universal stress UspA family protein
MGVVQSNSIHNHNALERYTAVKHELPLRFLASKKLHNLCAKALFIYFSPEKMIPVSINNPKILVPIDFSRCSEYAVEYAKAIVKPLNGSLHLLHVIETPVAYGEWGYSFAQAGIASSSEIAESAMLKQVEALAKEGFTVSFEIMTGTPYFGIASYADEHKMDLLIISTHGRHGMERFLMGSTTERVIRTVHCPVLSVHPPHEYLEENKNDKVKSQK